MKKLSLITSYILKKKRGSQASLFSLQMQKLSQVVIINSMAYLEIKIPVSPEMMEIIVAELSYLPYNSFEEKEDKQELYAYILEEDFEAMLDSRL